MKDKYEWKLVWCRRDEFYTTVYDYADKGWGYVGVWDTHNHPTKCAVMFKRSQEVERDLAS